MSRRGFLRGALGASAALALPGGENGFSLLDVTPESVRISFFRWTPADGATALDRLEPFEVIDLPRPVPG